MSPNSRIKELRLSLGLSQQAFADRLGVSRSYLKDIEIERCEPSFNFLRTLSGVYNTNLNWITTGDGEIYQNSDVAVTTEVCNSDNRINKMFEQLTVEQQQVVFSITQEMVKMNLVQQEVKQLSDEIKAIKDSSSAKK